MHLPIGAGNVDFMSILKALVDAGDERTITLEVKKEFQEAGGICVKTLVRNAGRG